MEERLALVVQSKEELREKLKAFCRRDGSVEQLFRGQVKRNKDMLSALDGR